ncbi:MAG: c-type cytochrome [Nitrospira sp.]|nr:c-type cytochrome [Candidatus Manganitrophaceae bacterium]HIL35280.1 c-type cytochrome [Candidatus Manganitrophaceae bacterium]
MIRKIEKSRGKKWAALVAVSVFSLLGLGGIADAQIMRIGPAPIEPAPGTYKPAKEDGGTIDKGKTVYFKKCVWCHGPDGAGDGPSAIRLVTKPRNFNAGTFKIRHTGSGELPTDEDLLNTVRHGLQGSVMPPWAGILTDEEMKAAIAFIKKELVKDREFDDPDEEITVISYGTQIPSSPESIELGRDIYMNKAKCVECHGQEGRGNGNLTQRGDWGFPIFPANLQKPWNLRGNRRDPYNPRNIFREVSTGLNGTPMPSFADELSEEERWHVANFVISLTKIKYPLDPNSGKPSIGFVIKSKFIEEGGTPSDPNDEKWNVLPPQYVGLASQIIQPPRHFIRTIDDIRVTSLYDDKEVAILFEWDDRTESHLDPDGEAVYDMNRLQSEAFPAIATTQFTHEIDGARGPLKNVNELPNGVYNDGIAIQFGQAWQDIPPPAKWYFIHGDEKRGVDLWKWESDGTAKEYEGHGIDKVVLREGSDNVKVVYAKWTDGRWQVIMKRALLTDDKEKSAQLVNGVNIPITFFAWDGDAGETGGRMALSTFYYLMMEPPVPTNVYIVPPIVFGIIFGCLVWARKAAINYKEPDALPEK